MERFEYLFHRYLSREATDADRSEFLAQLSGKEYDEKLKALIDAHFSDFNPHDFDPRLAPASVILHHILTGGHGAARPLRVRIVRWRRFVAAAAIILMIIGSYYVFIYPERREVRLSDGKNIATGGFGATLTLADGSKISLNKIKVGQIAEQGGISIKKTAAGQIVYVLDNVAGKTASAFNTLSTGKGQSFMLQLPDSSVIWLNANSSLTYPLSMNIKGKRYVTLHGEGYFEVSKDRRHPFVVETGGQRVNVLGTKFNINGYPDEMVIKTTLLEGSVKVESDHRELIIRPGQQASYRDGLLAEKKVDEQSEVDWVNGQFDLNDRSLEEIMRKIARWYDLEVIYDNVDKDRKFGGSISRFDNIAKVLEKLELTGSVKFRIEGRRVTVSK